MRIVPCLVWGGNPRNRAERSVSVCCDIPQPQTRQGVCCGLCGGVRLAQVIVPVVAWAPSPLEMTSPVLRARGGRRGCGVRALPVLVVAGGPCGPDSPGASPSPERPACPRPRSATFAHDV